MAAVNSGAAGAYKPPSDKLRAKVAELEQRLAGGAAAQAAQAPTPVVRTGLEVQSEIANPAAPVVEPLLRKLVEELEAELADLQDAKMGMTDDKKYVFAVNDETATMPIYKRKQEVLGMTITQQATYTKSFRRMVKKAKGLKSMDKLCKLWKGGGDGMTKQEVRTACGQLRATSPQMAVIVRDVMPEILDDPNESAIANFALLIAIGAVALLLCVCILPPASQIEE